MIIPNGVGKSVAVVTVLSTIALSMLMLPTPPPKDRERFEELRVLVREGPAARIDVLVPEGEHPRKKTMAVLKPYNHTGIRVLNSRGKMEGGTSALLYVTDTLAFHRARHAESRILTYLKDSEKMFCVFGLSRGDDDDDGASSFVRLVQGHLPKKDRKASPPVRVICSNEHDAWTLNAVLFASGVYNVFEDLEIVTVPIVDLGTEMIKGGDDVIVVGASWLTSRHRKEVWHAFDDRDSVWYDVWENTDMHRLKVVLPFVKTKAIDVQDRLLPKLQAERRVFTVLCVDAVIAGSADAESHPLLPLLANVLIRADVDNELDIVVANNFLSMHFPFYEAALRIAADKNATIYKKRVSASSGGAIGQIGRPRFSVLEQFTVSPSSHQKTTLEIQMAEGVHGYKQTVEDTDRKVSTFTVDVHKEPLLTVSGRFFHLRGIPVHMRDRIRLGGQTREVENGSYFVKGIDVVKGRLVLQDHPILEFQEGADVAGAKEGGRVVEIVFKDVRHRDVLVADRTFVEVGDLVYVRGVGENVSGSSGKVVERTEKTGVTRVRLTFDKDDENARDIEDDERFGGGGFFHCFEDTSVPVKEMCDELGLTWDRPCKNDEECPYFQANKNYPNYRGGCIAGHCEMPLGIRKRGYRVPEYAPAPICHGCEDPFAGNCCAIQRRSSNFGGPDYAFELDFHERQGDRKNRKKIDP